MKTARDVIRETQGMPTLNVVVTELASLMRSDTANVKDFEKVIKPDPALTANLLRLANSAFFGLRRKVESVRQAISLLGTKRLFELATSASFQRVLPPKIPGYGIDSRAFYTHCIAVAVMSERLAKMTGKNPKEMTFTAGLLHDIGKLAIGSILMTEGDGMLEKIFNDGYTFVAAEKNTIGTDHCEVGALMAEEWDLPNAVANVIRWHHVPGEKEGSEHSNLIDLVHVADGLAHSMGFGTDVGELSRNMETASLERLGLSKKDLETTACDTAFEIREMSKMLNAECGG